MSTHKRVQDTHSAPSARIVAVNFCENSYLEMLLKLRARDLKTYNTLSPALIASVNQYAANKREFEHLQAIKTESLRA
jgi:hypothetical protein